MEYNTSRPHMQISEYGRNVQSMVEHLLTITDREERNRKANLIVNIMGFLNPQMRDSVDWKHKLWDHLHIISDFKLDVDAPYAPPAPEQIAKRPEPLGYPDNKILFRYYGKTVEKLIHKATEMEDGPTKVLFINLIGSFMRTACRQWNDEALPDEAVISHLEYLSEGKIKLQLEEGVHDFGRGDKLQSRSRQQFQQTPNRNNKNRNNKFRPNNNNNRNNPNRNKK
ncbi:MAG: DUF4290 domain-containing protein [Bacteroidia bacterium]